MFIFIDVLYTKPKWKYSAYATEIVVVCLSLSLILALSGQSKFARTGFKFKKFQSVENFKSHKWYWKGVENLRTWNEE